MRVAVDVHQTRRRERPYAETVREAQSRLSMLKRILLIGFLALPGSFVVVSLACVHPRIRARLAELTYAPQLLARVNRRNASFRHIGRGGIRNRI